LSFIFIVVSHAYGNFVLTGRYFLSYDNQPI
jgi:hypothetical protein